MRIMKWVGLLLAGTSFIPNSQSKSCCPSRADAGRAVEDTGGTVEDAGGAVEESGRAVSAAAGFSFVSVTIAPTINNTPR
jgi:hypothetical protein